MRKQTALRRPGDASSRGVRRRGLDRRAVLKATAGGATGVSLAGCLGSFDSVVGGSDDDESITIGLLAPQPESNYIGRSMVQSAEVAVDALNEEGGIDDTPVDLVVRDTNASPLEARRQYQRLILEDGADVTMGVFDSPALRNIMDDIAEQETLHLTSASATAAASRMIADDYEKYKYHFRVGPTNDYHLGRSQIRFVDDMADDLGWDSIALLAEDYEWTEAPWEVYQDELDGTGVDVVMEERYPPATDDFTDLYDEAEAQGADTVLITTAHTGTEAMLDWSYPNRPDPTPQPRPFAFGGTHVPMQLPSYYEQTGGACRYGFGQISATADIETGGGTQEFVEAYRDEYGDVPVYTGYHTHDAVTLYAHAVEEAGTLDDDTLVETIEDTSITGVAGTLEFYGPDDEYPHDLYYFDDDTLYFQWQENDAGEGVQEVIWPDTYATSEYVSPSWL